MITETELFAMRFAKWVLVHTVKESRSSKGKPRYRFFNDGETHEKTYTMFGLMKLFKKLPQLETPPKAT